MAIALSVQTTWGKFGSKKMRLFRTTSEKRRLKAIKKGQETYFPYEDGLLCLSVEETTKGFFKGLDMKKETQEDD